MTSLRKFLAGHDPAADKGQAVSAAEARAAFHRASGNDERVEQVGGERQFWQRRAVRWVALAGAASLVLAGGAELIQRHVAGQATNLVAVVPGAPTDDSSPRVSSKARTYDVLTGRWLLVTSLAGPGQDREQPSVFQVKKVSDSEYVLSGNVGCNTANHAFSVDTSGGVNVSSPGEFMATFTDSTVQQRQCKPELMAMDRRLMDSLTMPKRPVNRRAVRVTEDTLELSFPPEISGSMSTLFVRLPSEQQRIKAPVVGELAPALAAVSKAEGLKPLETLTFSSTGDGTGRVAGEVGCLAVDVEYAVSGKQWLVEKASIQPVSLECASSKEQADVLSRSLPGMSFEVFMNAHTVLLKRVVSPEGQSFDSFAVPDEVVFFGESSVSKVLPSSQ